MSRKNTPESIDLLNRLYAERHEAAEKWGASGRLDDHAAFVAACNALGAAMTNVERVGGNSYPNGRASGWSPPKPHPVYPARSPRSSSPPWSDDG